MRICPDEGEMSPRMSRRRVVFPVLFPPMTATVAFGGMSSEKFSKRGRGLRGGW